MWAQVSFVLPQSTRLSDRRTEEQTAFCGYAVPYMQLHGKTVKQRKCAWGGWNRN